MCPKKGTKSKVNVTKEAVDVPDEDQITISGNLCNLSDSQNTKKKEIKMI